MRAGELRHKITIQQATEVQDDYGEPDSTWSTYRTVRASKKKLSTASTASSETFKNDVREAFNIVVFGIRYLSGITPKMRISHDGNVFNILNIDNIEDRNREILLTCRRII